MPEPTTKAVFLSYASQDAEAAKKICDALRAAGVDVWFDQEGGLEHGDEWDQKIRRQIKECVLFLPLISANTQAREEGYFRIEWELAAERAMGFASGVAFVLPIVIDDTREPDALVPDRFRKVQWTRVPGGVLAPDVLGRMVKLWSHRAGAVSHRVGGARGSGPETDKAAVQESQAKPQVARRVPATAWAVAAAAAIVALALVWRRPAGSASSSPAGAGTHPPTPENTSAPSRAAKMAPAANEAEQLLARIKAICDKISYTRDELALAEDFARRATDLEPTSARTWAARAYVGGNYMNRGWDRGDKRAREVQSSANRALALNPEEPEALMALGLVLSFQGAATTQVEPLFRRAIAAAPADGRPRRLLGAIFSLRGRNDEAVAMLEEAARLNPRDALVHYNLATHHAARGNLPEAWQHAESALAIAPAFGSAQLLKASLAVRWKGDLAAMRTALDQIPDAERGDDRSVYFAMWGGLMERNPERVFAAAALGTNDYLRDNLFTGPKAWLTALAFESVAKGNLARMKWREAELLLRQRLREDSKQNSSDRWRLAYTLARLGQIEEAAREVAPFELAAGDQLRVGSAQALAQYYAALGDAAKAAPYLRFALTNGGNGGYGGFTPHLLRLEPEWDKLRGKPEFEALLAEAKVAENGSQMTEGGGQRTRTGKRSLGDGDPAAASLPPPAVALSEAAKLVARAKALYTKLNYTREDLAVAEELARKATELEADSAAAWGARAGVQATYLYRNWDVSEKRRLETQNAASRALGLNPDEPEALLALGHLLTLQRARPQAEAALRRVLAAAPNDNRSARALGIFLGRAGRVEEERAILRDALKRDPRDPLLHYDLAMTFANYGADSVAPADITAAIEQLDAGIAVQPLGSLLLLKASLMAGYRGDLPAMRAQLDQLEKMPLSERTEDRAVFIAMWGGLLERNSARVVAAGTLTAKNYFEDTVVPRRSKDWALALAHHLEGKENLARLDWQKAESVLRQRQREDANNQTYPVELAATLAWLGRKDEAAREVAPIEAAWREELTAPRARALALYYGAVGDAAKAAPYLRRALVSSVFTTAYALRFDPWWDQLRGEPEFEALLTEPAK